MVEVPLPESILFRGCTLVPFDKIAFEVRLARWVHLHFPLPKVTPGKKSAPSMGRRKCLLAQRANHKQKVTFSMEFDDDCHQGPAESGPEIQLVLSGSLQSDALWMSSVDCNGIAKNSENVRYLVCRRDECV